MARSSSRICPILVGRETELARGAELLTEAAAGHGRLLLLVGEAGIGKSRLARAVSETATWRGFRVLTGVCQEYDRDCPYAPLLDALRALLHREGAIVAALEGQERAVLARLVPELGMAADPPIPALPPEHEKRRIFEAFVHLGLALSRDAPLLIVLEDLHWADATSLELIPLLARRLVGARVMMLATMRSDEPGSDPGSWLAALERERLVTRLDLAPLTGPDVATMIAATVDSPLPLPVVTTINARAEGNPFLVEELVHLLADDAVSGVAWWEGWGALMPGHVPAVVARTVARRLDALDGGARTVAEAGAAVGRRFSFDLLRQLTGLDEAALIGALRQLIAVHLIVEESIEARACFAFRHALARDAIYDRLLEPERRRLHRRIAHVLATETGDWPTPSDGELGYHYFAAKEWERALLHCRRAGEQAQALYTPRAAVEHFSRALIAAERTTASRTDLLMRRGEAYEWMGDLDHARHDFDMALAEAQASGDRSLEWRALMRMSTSWGGGVDVRGVPYVEEALVLARAMDDASATGHSLNHLGYFAIFLDRPTDARRYHEEALALFTSLGDERGIAETLERLGYARYFGADFVGGVSDLHAALARYTRLNDRRGMVYSLAGLAERTATLQTDWMVPATVRIADAVAEGERALALSRESGWRFGEAYSQSFLAYCFGATGEYGRALRGAHDALEIADEIEQQALQFFAQGALGILYLELLVLPVAMRHFHRALALARRFGSSHHLAVTTGFIVTAQIARGDLEQAEALLGGVWSPELPMETFSQRRLWLAAAELALARGESPRAVAITDRLIGRAPNIATASGRSVPRIDRVRGEALVALGWHEQAEQTFRVAMGTATEQGARPLVWRLQSALGALLHKTRRPREAARAFAAAQRVIEELAATVPDDHTRGIFLRAALATIPRAYLTSARRVAKEQYGGLTAREREVVTLIASGKTNRAIAAELFVTEKTIELHVSNSLRKLNCHTRAELAAWAVSSGLIGADAEKRAGTR